MIWHIWHSFIGTLFQKMWYKKVIMVIFINSTVGQAG